MENFACGTLLLSLLGVSKCVDKNRKYYNASFLSYMGTENISMKIAMHKF